jgi:hypothetical protein
MAMLHTMKRLHMRLHYPKIIKVKDELVHFSTYTQYQEVVIRSHTACFSVA